jgi:hypothetical protein
VEAVRVAALGTAKVSGEASVPDQEVASEAGHIAPAAASSLRDCFEK